MIRLKIITRLQKACVYVLDLQVFQKEILGSVQWSMFRNLATCGLAEEKCACQLKNAYFTSLFSKLFSPQNLPRHNFFYVGALWRRVKSCSTRKTVSDSVQHFMSYMRYWIFSIIFIIARYSFYCYNFLSLPIKNFWNHSWRKNRKIRSV